MLTFLCIFGRLLWLCKLVTGLRSLGLCKTNSCQKSLECIGMIFDIGLYHWCSKIKLSFIRLPGPCLAQKLHKSDKLGVLIFKLLQNICNSSANQPFLIIIELNPIFRVFFRSFRYHFFDFFLGWLILVLSTCLPLLLSDHLNIHIFQLSDDICIAL